MNMHAGRRPRFKPLSFCPVMFFCLGLIPLAIGQKPLQTLLVGVDRRNVTSLDGQWHYLIDRPPFGALYTSSGAINDRGYARNTHPNISSGPHNDEYDFATAPTLKVPRRLEHPGTRALHL